MSSIYNVITSGIRGASAADDVRRASLVQHSTYTQAEAVALSEKIRNQPKVPATTPGASGVYAYATSVNSAMTQRIEENREILKLMPDVMQTATIHRAAIQAPNDLQITPMAFITDYPLITDVVRKQVQDIIEKEVETHLQLSTKLSGIIHRAIFEVGAECFITLPSSKIDEALSQQIVDKRGGRRPLSAMESVSVVEREATELKSHIITNVPHNKKHDKHGLESGIGLEDARDILTNTTRQFSQTKSSYKISDDVAREVAMFVHPDNLMLVDNVDFLRADVLRSAVALENLESVLVPKPQYRADTDPNLTSVFSDRGGPAFITSLDGSNTPNSKKIKGEPIIFGCPANSLIPIIRSGHPSNHHGYLLISDIDGMTFTGDSLRADRGTMSSIGSSKVTIGSTVMSRNERFAKLNQMMTGQGVLSGDNDIVMRAIHKETVKAFIQKKLRDGGLRGISVPERNDIYEFLFANYMAGQPSRIVFIPQQLVTYITLHHNPIDGTGDSALESIKDTLAHLLTLRMARLSAATLNAVNRRTININFSPKFRGMHQQVIDEIVRAHIERSNTTSTFNPAIISQDLVRKAVTVKVTGAPGMDAFSAEVQPSESQRSVPDSDLADDLDKTYKAGLFVPAAATNNLAEAEYARSVATTNIHYAQVVTDHQLVICNGITHIVRNLLRYSERIRKAVLGVISGSRTNSDGTVLSDTQAIDYDDFVDSIYARLPKPNLPANNLKLEIIPQAISNIGSIVESLYPDTLYAGADADTYQTMQTIRAYVTQMLVRKLLDDIGSSDSLGTLPTLQDMVLESGNLTEQRMSIESVQSAIAELSKLVTKLKENSGQSSDAAGSDQYTDTTGNDQMSDNADSDNADETQTPEDSDTTADNQPASDDATSTTDTSEKPEDKTDDNKGDAFDKLDNLEF